MDLKHLSSLTGVVRVLEFTRFSVKSYTNHTAYIENNKLEIQTFYRSLANSIENETLIPENCRKRKLMGKVGFYSRKDKLTVPLDMYRKN